jgi:dihydrodipicolinate synthase/N-acetylneuraminate lyase
MSGEKEFSGVVPIPVTAFSDDGSLDLDGIRAQVHYCLEAGAHGLLYPGVVSEFYTLTDRERLAAVEACVEAVAGRVPFMVGVSAASTAASAEFSRHAASVGADAVMTMAPFIQHFFSPSADLVLRHVEAVASAAQLPVIFQNARIGHPVGAATLASIVDEVPGVEYIKEESHPPTQGITAVLDALGDRLRGVFGGIGGVYLVNELERGAIGTMPSPAFVPEIVAAYEAYRSDGADAAQARLDRLGSLFTRELLYNAVLIKEVLRRRGVLASTAVRIASPTLDPADLADLTRLLDNASLRDVGR